MLNKIRRPNRPHDKHTYLHLYHTTITKPQGGHIIYMTKGKDV